jgi:hypothetical protein
VRRTPALCILHNCMFCTALPANARASTHPEATRNASKMRRPYLLLKYQAKAPALVASPNGVGTSAKPGLATGCLKYTAAHMF